MIHVIATATVKPGCMDKFLEIFHANIPAVRAEEGCISYTPCRDLETGFPVQPPLRDNAVIIVECWESLDHLKKHLQAPHMLAYKEKVKDLVEGGSVVQVVKPTTGE